MKTSDCPFMHMYKRRQKKKSGLESVGPREVICVYGKRNVNLAKSEKQWRESIIELTCVATGYLRGGIEH